MTSVIATKTAKMVMLIAGLPMVALSAAFRSSTRGTPGHRRVAAVGTGGVLVVLEPLTHLVGDGVGALVGVRDVEVGDDERRHELAQTQEDAEVDVAEHRGGHELRRVGRE